MRVVVIVPTYNERESICTLLDELHSAVRKVPNHTVSFLIVDDTSPDGTYEVVREYQKTHKAVSLLTGQRQGLGKALLRGMLYAAKALAADSIVQMDADLSHDPAVLPRFLKEIDQGANFVVGSRYIPGGSIPQNWALHRKIFSVIGNSIVRFGLGYLSVHDWTGGYRAYRKKFVLELKDEVACYSGYVFQIAFLHKAILHGARVTEVPIHFTDRRFGHSKIAPSRYIRDVLLYVIKARLRSVLGERFVKFAAVGFVGFLIDTVVLEFLVAMGWHPSIGSAVGAEVAIVSNFILNNAWTFQQHKITGGGVLGKFLQFNAASVGAIGLQAAAVWVGTRLFGVPTYRLFYLVGVGLALVWNYTMYTRVIWRI